jgi:RNA polymerase sigma factor (sigma-70 family)
MNDSLSELSALSGLPREAFADAVFERYAERLMRLARERLGSRLQAKVSAEDVVQSALHSFFRRRDEFAFAQDGADGLWGLLVVITLRKCAKWADVFSAQKRSAAREVNLQPGDGSVLPLASSEPDPAEAAMLAELLEGLLRHFDSRQQQMLALRMQGFELEEIAAQVQSSRRTVARTVAEAKEWLRERMQS